MKNEEIEYLDGEFTVNEDEPSTLAEVVQLIGEDAVVSETTSNLRYRNKYPRVYKAVSREIEPHFPRAEKKRETKKDGTEKIIKVSENDHLREYLKTGDDARAKLQELFTTVGQREALYVKGERTGGGGKVAARTLEAAQGYINEGDNKVEAIIEYIEGQVPGYKVGRDAEGSATVDSLARGIQALTRHSEAEAKRKTEQGLQALGKVGGSGE